MLTIDLKDLPVEGLDVEGEAPASILDLAAGEQEVRIASPVRYAFHVQAVGNELIAQGRASVEAVFPCSRCAEPFVARVEDPAFVCVRELNAEGRTQFVDLTPDIRETILLAFPSHPVCQPECKGLCPRCGKNWNNESCQCGPPAGERWGGLDILDAQS